jgi:hypothetical protein
MNDVGLKAKRGKDLSLSVAHLEKDLGERLPTMKESLDQFFTDSKNGIPGRIKQGQSEKPQGVFYPLRQEISYGGSGFGPN